MNPLFCELCVYVCVKTVGILIFYVYETKITARTMASFTNFNIM